MKFSGNLKKSILFGLLSTSMAWSSDYRVEVSVKNSTDPNCKGFVFDYKITANYNFKIKDITEYKNINKFVDRDEMAKTLKEKFSSIDQTPKVAPTAFAFDPKTGKAISNPKQYCMTYDLKLNYTFVYANEWKEISSSDLILAVPSKFESRYSSYTKGEFRPAGMAPLFGRFIFIDESSFNRSSQGVRGHFAHILMHEEGHRLGLEHTDNINADNLMSYKVPFSNVIDNPQRTSIIEHFIQSIYSKLVTEFSVPGKSFVTIKKTLNFGDNPKDQVNDILKYETFAYKL